MGSHVCGKFVTHYYTVNIPSDSETDKERRGELAWLQINANPNIPYRMPTESWVVWDDGENVRMAIRSHRKALCLS